MTDRTTSQETDGGAPQGTDYIRIARSGGNRKLSFAAILDWIASSLTKGDIGLGDVDNTSDEDKPLSTLTQAAITGLSDAVALRLPLATGNMVYYVRPDGSDSNNGLADTAAGAFLTVARALAVASSLFGNGYTCTINSRLTTQSATVRLPKMYGWTSGSLIGDTVTPANRVISTTSADAVISEATGTFWTVRGFRLQTTTSGNGIYCASAGAVIGIGEIDFGACAAYHIRVGEGYVLATSSNLRIVGNAVCFAYLEDKGMLSISGRTVTFVGSITYSSAFVVGMLAAIFKCVSVTFTGTFTGKRHELTTNAIISSGGATEATYFPGSVVGTKATQAQWV